MAVIIIERTDFKAADILAQCLNWRMAETIWAESLNAHHNADASCRQSLSSQSPSSSYQAFVCSKTYADKVGGLSVLIEKSRGLKATKLMVIEDRPDLPFALASEMRGHLMSLTLGASDSQPAALQPDNAHNYAVHLACSLLLDEAHVAVADKESFAHMHLAKRVSKTDVTIFINGPTGTGKEVLARFIHTHSQRCDAPFVAVNCAAIPENMLEAILFGHEKGAFTGASTANKGIFRAADGGTLLLDEISEMPLGLQAKLLRALQERKVTPLGSQREIDIDVRVIATTNRHMMTEISAGRFREDLFYRLNVFPLTTHALEARKADIIAISTLLLKRHAPNLEDIPCMDASAIQMLLDYNWPGNVRELENILQRALVLCSDGVITNADIMVDSVIGTQLSAKTFGTKWAAADDAARPSL